jgi:hypothetical protein
MVVYSMRTITDKNISLGKMLKRNVICLLGIATIRTISVGVDGHQVTICVVIAEQRQYSKGIGSRDRSAVVALETVGDGAFGDKAVRYLSS